MDIKRGDIVEVNLPKIYGKNVQGGNRPCVVVQNDIGNMFSTVTIVCPITHNLKKLEQKTHVIFQGDSCNLPCRYSMILAEQILTINKENIVDCYGSLNEYDIQKLNAALKMSIGLEV